MTTRDQVAQHAPDGAPVREIVVALDKLLDGEDRHLLLINASERSIAHRLATHMEGSFSGWHVDCEYNRDHHEPKVTNLNWSAPESREEEEARGSLVLPDIIVHRRNSHENFLAIEMKKSTNTNSDDHDLLKLKTYLKEPLCYRYALFLRWSVGDDPGLDRVIWVRRA